MLYRGREKSGKEPGMQTITKRDLIDRVASATGHRRADVKCAIAAFLEVMVEELARGNRIEFREFGVFETKERAARTAQNPKTLEPVIVPPRRTVKFKAGRQMRDRLESTALAATISAEAAPAGKGVPRSRRATPAASGRHNGSSLRIEVKPARSGAAV
jgi:integration host factor subunit beta